MKYIFIGLLVLSVLSFMSACASQPEDIASAYISPMQYADFNCTQMAAEARSIEVRVSQLQGSLEEEADADTVQMVTGIIFFFPLFWLEGGDGVAAAEYSRLKGQREALEQAGIQKECGLAPMLFAPVAPEEVQAPVRGSSRN